MSIKIRAYCEDDLPTMLSIWNEVVAAGQAFPQEEPERDGKFFAAQSFCGVAEDETGQICGLYILHPNNVGRCSHICNASYAVSAAARGRGIGKLLVLDSLKVARDLGFEIMQFNAVAADNDAANSLYPKLGFQKLGAIPGGFRRPDGSHMTINLYYRPL